jgi:hypothetical protein
MRVSGGDRDALSATLSSVQGVLAVSPSGSRIRVVAQRSAEQAVTQAVASANATFEPVAPDFEDLFLTLMCEGAN